MKENLFIFGNGFDMACGLRSSYQDFFQYRMSAEVLEELEEFNDNFVKEYHQLSLKSIFFGQEKEGTKHIIEGDILGKTKNAKLTFWDILFYIFDKNEKNQNWYDVENSILSILKMIDEKKDYSCLGWKSRHGFPGALVISGDEASQVRICLREASVIGYYVLPEERYVDCKNMFEFLYSELRQFEIDFSDYLTKEIESHQGGYFIAVEELFKNIAGEKIVESNDFSVLSFNYTTPKILRDAATNVHGTLRDRNIIFGIDQNVVDASTSMFRFTKTFRKMIQLVDENTTKTYISDRDKLKRIYFYGHSLGEADYSYFQSIFDYYDIYGSNIQLIFCCSKYGSKTSDEVLSETSVLVGRLLSNYGPTMGNENRAKNILHKMMLENRLHIKLIQNFN